MREFTRVILNKKTILFLLVLLMANVTFCLFQCNDSKEITLTGEALKEYLSGYPQYLKETRENVTFLQGISLFEDEDSFALKNIRKTAADYQVLEKITVESGENRGIVIYTRFQLTNFLLLGFVLYLVLRFTEEQKKGLQLLVRSTVGGRIPLLLKRVGILGFGTLLAAVLLYGSTLLVVLLRYPGADLGRAIQSVPEFIKCVYPVSVGEYLALDICNKVFGGVLIGMLLFGLSTVLSSGAAMAVFLMALTLEYICYTVIVPTSEWAGVKFLNVCAMLFGRDGFLSYLNLNFFGKPALLLKGQFLLGMVFLAGLVIVSLVACARSRSQTVGVLAYRLERIAAWYSRHRRPVSGFVWEARKILFKQKGLAILALAAYLAFSSSLEFRYADLRNPYEMMWYEEFAGPITKASVACMEDVRTDLAAEREKLLENIAQINERLAKLGPSDPARMWIGGDLSEKEERLGEVNNQLAGLNKVLVPAHSGLEYSLETGKELWLLEPYTYHLLLENDEKTYERNRLYVLLAVIGTFSGVMAYESKAKMEPVLRTAYRGNRTLWYKCILVVFFSAVTALGIHMIQFVQIGQSFPYHGMEYPVQSIECMREFPLPVSIFWYLILLYGWRCLYTAGMGLLVMSVSKLVKDRVACIAVCTAGLLLPVFLMVIF